MRIYTIGHLPLETYVDFVQNLQRYHVNCVVDVRRNPEVLAYREFCGQELKENLNKEKILYLSFEEEFGGLETIMSNHKTSGYKRCIETEGFKKGMLRLKTGVEKGFCIALLGSDVLPYKCIRCKVIGKFLFENDWEVIHILKGGRIVSQQSIEEHEMNVEEERIKKNEESKKLGRDGEELVANHLILKGYRILQKNWNLYKGCEIDIIAFKDNKLHAVEVKTRRDDSIMKPEQAVDDTKLVHIRKAINEYRYRNSLMNIECQIDTAAVVLRNEQDYDIRIFEDVVRRCSWFYK